MASPMPGPAAPSASDAESDGASRPAATPATGAARSGAAGGKAKKRRSTSLQKGHAAKKQRTLPPADSAGSGGSGSDSGGDGSKIELQAESDAGSGGCPTLAGAAAAAFAGAGGGSLAAGNGRKRTSGEGVARHEGERPRGPHQRHRLPCFVGIHAFDGGLRSSMQHRVSHDPPTVAWWSCVSGRCATGSAPNRRDLFALKRLLHLAQVSQ